jgi:glutamate dehydrogenase/leucine dehydrogenase
MDKMVLGGTMEELVPEEIPDSPLFVAEVKDAAFDLQAWVVIHSLGADCSCGGVRLYPDVSREEVELLARAMTYKYCFYGITDRGGGKAGVQLSLDSPTANRARTFRRFGEHIRPLLRSKVYSPYTDMGSSANDIMHIYQGAGIKRDLPLSNTAYSTALSTFAAVVATAEYYQISPEQCKITIEGLGKVGAHLAVEISRWGGKLIGASTRVGAVANPRGLDVKEILAALEKCKDFWVKENGNWETLGREQLLSLPSNIHIPCARVHSITEEVVRNLVCRAIVPAANVPCTPEAEVELYEKGIMLLPDFVVNSGGIVGPGPNSDNGTRSRFVNDFKVMVKRLVRLSEVKQVSPVVLASLECQKNFRNLWMAGRKGTPLSRRIIRALGRRVIIPKKFTLKSEASRISRIIRERFI